MRETKVNIVPEDRGWILEKIGLSLAERLGYIWIGDRPHPQSPFNYYVNDSAFRGSGPTRDMAFFTHTEYLAVLRMKGDVP